MQSTSNIPELEQLRLIAGSSDKCMFSINIF